LSHRLPTPLPPFDRALLRAVVSVVPAGERAEWTRAWESELWHDHRRRGAKRGSLTAGVVCDALWLRADAWRRRFEGTAVLCIASLTGLCLLSASITFALTGSWTECANYLSTLFARFLIAAPLVVFVTTATTFRRPLETGVSSSPSSWFGRQLFFGFKLALILLLTFLLSANLCQPLATTFPNLADVLQLFSFVVLALLGLRWGFTDQEQRCKQCLRSLAAPCRVGRPSHNLLEWNGTELLCKQGHGLLSIPEIETSWHQSSEWIGQQPAWDEAASA
jgi:hypothetical protein